LIGARLRFGLSYVEQRILDALAAAGFPDIQVAHFKVLRFPPPENERPIDLAQRAGMTKQAMNYLLVQLEEMGYVERVAAEGTTARRISLTERGWAVARIQRYAVRDVEQEWEARIGKARFAQFYAVLKELTDT
jgi:DNA-binding MarR family transcriptional regulator